MLLPDSLPDWVGGMVRGAWVAGAEVAGGPDADAVKATTWLAAGASRRPAPTLGVGK